MRRKSAISSFLEIAQLPNPLKTKYLNELIKRELVQANRQIRAEQASALTGDLLEHINSIVSPDCLVNARDLSLVNTMFDGLLRASEAANLTIGNINRRNNTQFIAVAKNDQSGQGSFRYLSNTSISYIDTYLDLASLNISEARGFRSLANQHLFRGLSPKATSVLFSQISYPSIYRAFQRLARLAELDLHLSTHSARIGAAVTMAEHQVGDLDIQRAGGWKSTSMPSRYTEQARVAQGGMAQVSATFGR